MHTSRCQKEVGQGPQSNWVASETMMRWGSGVSRQAHCEWISSVWGAKESQADLVAVGLPADVARGCVVTRWSPGNAVHITSQCRITVVVTMRKDWNHSILLISIVTHFCLLCSILFHSVLILAGHWHQMHRGPKRNQPTSSKYHLFTLVHLDFWWCLY